MVCNFITISFYNNLFAKEYNSAKYISPAICIKPLDKLSLDGSITLNGFIMNSFILFFF